MVAVVTEATPFFRFKHFLLLGIERVLVELSALELADLELGWVAVEAGAARADGAQRLEARSYKL